MGLLLGFIILAIFFFLGKTILVNWQKVREYQFSFNYFYLIISLFFATFHIVFVGFIWSKILRTLDPRIKISNLKVLKIFVYSWFGRYVPGKVWMSLGKVYLGNREGLPLRTLTISAIFEIVLMLVSAFWVSMFFLSITLGTKLAGLYYIIGAIIIVGGLILLRPKIFYPLCNMILRKFKKNEMSLEPLLGYKEIIKIIFYYSIAFILEGIGFFLLINSIVYLPPQNIMGMIGIFNLAGIMGVIVFFAPGGLGVREGVMAGLLQFYFPVGLAVLISLITRLWATLPELVLLGFIYLANRSKKT